MLLEGLILPLPTPFYPDGRLYLRKLEHNADRYSKTLAAGLAVGTPVGEAARLSDEELRVAMQSVAAATARESVLLADVSRGSVRATLELAEAAAALDFDVLLVRPPSVTGGSTREEQRIYLQAVADQAPLPLVLLEERTERLPIDLIAEMAGSGNVLGWCAVSSDVDAVTDVLRRTGGRTRDVIVTPTFEAVTGRMLRQRMSSGGATYLAAESLASGGTATLAQPVLEPALKTRTRRVGFQVIGGRTEAALAMLGAGARALMPAMGACAPQASHEVWAAWKDGDSALAAEKFERVSRGAARIEEVMGVPGLKAAADLNGYFGGAPRLPGLPLLRSQSEEVQQLMRSMRH